MNPDVPLQKDPAVALPDVRVSQAYSPGPVRSQQFVIELVGPRTAPADSVKAILRPEWQGEFSAPEVYVMAGGDSRWRPLFATDAAGAYDSIALSWDFLSEDTPLTYELAQRLWTASEDLARQLSRRALAIPVPGDVAQAVAVLRELKESLDIGINMSVCPVHAGFSERDIWTVAANLGLDYAPEGVFRWQAAGSDYPLFEVYSQEEGVRFSLDRAQHGVVHGSLGLGFSLPLCPEPRSALDGCVRATKLFAERLQGRALDEEDRPLTEESVIRMKSDLEQAIIALTKAGLAPGTREAVKLFAT